MSRTLEEIKNGIRISNFVGSSGLLVLYKNLVYFFGLELGAYLSLLIDDELGWKELNDSSKDNVEELPFMKFEEIEKSLPLARERSIYLLDKLVELGMVSTIVSSDKERFFYKLDHKKLHDNLEEYINCLAEEEMENEKER